MSKDYGDMYQYILESKKAVRDIISNHEEIFHDAVEYFFEGDYEQIYVIGSGTSYHSALAAKRLMEKVLKMKVFASYPIVFKDEQIFNKKTLVMGLSHAGMSASTIAGLDKAKECGFGTIAMTAERGRPVEHHGDVKLYVEIGEEKAGPKTKGYIGSIVTFMIFALKVALKQGKITQEEFEDYLNRMQAAADAIPDIAEAASNWYLNNKEDLLKCRRLYVIGYDNCLADMMEGTLKICEAVRYSVQGFELEEFMHGIYHCIDENTYMLYVCSKGQYYDRILRLKRYFEEERHSHNFLITHEDTNNPKDLVFPFTDDEEFAVLQYIIPMQVLARKLSLDLGIDCNIPSDPQFHFKMNSYLKLLFCKWVVIFRLFTMFRAHCISISHSFWRQNCHFYKF